MPPRTVFRVLEETVQTHGSRPALYEPYTEAGKRKYRSWSWIQYQTAVEEIAAGLRSLGIIKGDVVALNSETRLEFYVADLGIMANGSIAAALYPNYPPRELVRTLQACEARAVFIENPKMLAALHDAPAGLWILLSGQPPPDDDSAITLDRLRERGRKAMADDPGLLQRLRDEVRPSDDAILYLTSGATGEPRMVVVSHAAVVANLDMGPAALPLGPDDRTIAFLPSAHIAQRIVVELLPMRSGMPVHFAESLMKLPQDLKAVRPTIFLAPPRMWERIYSTICTEVKKRPAAARRMFYAALGLSLAAMRYRQRGEAPPARIRVPLKLADRLVFRKVRNRFGGRLRIPASGAAPLGSDLMEFYSAMGMPIIEGYGLTEGGVVSFNPLGRPKPGSIGKALPGVKVRLASDGELLVKSPCLFSRYYNDPAATSQVLRHGWLHTGDIGSIGEEGYLFITGRKKEMIVSSNGKKIFPARVESLFKFEPLISQVLLVGDRMPYLAALFTINMATAETLKGMESRNGSSPAEIAAAEPVRAEVQQIVSRVNKQLAPFEQVRKFRILPRDLSIEEGELTATMKVRRMRVLENFRGDVEALYRGREREAE